MRIAEFAGSDVSSQGLRHLPRSSHMTAKVCVEELRLGLHEDIDAEPAVVAAPCALLDPKLKLLIRSS